MMSVTDSTCSITFVSHHTPGLLPLFCKRVANRWSNMAPGDPEKERRREVKFNNMDLSILQVDLSSPSSFCCSLVIALR